MTQLQDLEKEKQQIINCIRKVRQLTLRRFLFYALTTDLQYAYVKSRRARYDYTIALDIMESIIDYQLKYVELASQNDPELYLKTMEKALLEQKKE